MRPAQYPILHEAYILPSPSTKRSSSLNNWLFLSQMAPHATESPFSGQDISTATFKSKVVLSPPSDPSGVTDNYVIGFIQSHSTLYPTKCLKEQNISYLMALLALSLVHTYHGPRRQCELLSHSKLTVKVPLLDGIRYVT